MAHAPPPSFTHNRTKVIPCRIRFRIVPLIHKNRTIFLRYLEDTRLCPKEVTRIRLRYNGQYAYPICPSCNVTLDRSFQRYCDRCGQMLSWNTYYRITSYNK